MGRRPPADTTSPPSSAAPAPAPPPPGRNATAMQHHGDSTRISMKFHRAQEACYILSTKAQCNCREFIYLV
uniref:Uncharacterized protein n=1 Tax=Oryza sativa subsp. japonica TaxID=39947 RepID=Q69KF4_ORYSJ|nr:hypothetical protein [Oryza sativa Japonica Group]BAD36586.1 hypothetical protein [Oryza sativa Japonica Group]